MTTCPRRLALDSLLHRVIRGEGHLDGLSLRLIEDPFEATDVAFGALGVDDIDIGLRDAHVEWIQAVFDAEPVCTFDTGEDLEHAECPDLWPHIIEADL